MEAEAAQNILVVDDNPFGKRSRSRWPARVIRFGAPAAGARHSDGWTTTHPATYLSWI
jgi:hypothetical protein